MGYQQTQYFLMLTSKKYLSVTICIPRSALA